MGLLIRYRLFGLMGFASILVACGGSAKTTDPSNGYSNSPPPKGGVTSNNPSSNPNNPTNDGGSPIQVTPAANCASRCESYDSKCGRNDDCASFCTNMSESKLACIEKANCDMLATLDCDSQARTNAPSTEDITISGKLQRQDVSPVTANDFRLTESGTYTMDPAPGQDPFANGFISLLGQANVISPPLIGCSSPTVLLTGDALTSTTANMMLTIMVNSAPGGSCEQWLNQVQSSGLTMEYDHVLASIAGEYATVHVILTN